MNKLQEKIQGKTIFLLLGGASLEVLRRTIPLYRDLDATWCGINVFDVNVKHLLDPIGKDFSMVLDVSDVADVERYEKKCRIPRVLKYLERGGLFISKDSIIDNFVHFGHNIRKDYSNQLEIIDDYVRLGDVHNSLMAYIFLLTKFKAKRLFIFGCDGYQGEYIEHHAMLSYFCPDDIREDFEIGFGKIHCALASDTKAFNGSFEARYLKYCTLHQLVPLKIVNANPNSFITVFPRKNVTEIQHLLAEEKYEFDRKAQESN